MKLINCLQCGTIIDGDTDGYICFKCGTKYNIYGEKLTTNLNCIEQTNTEIIFCVKEY